VSSSASAAARENVTADGSRSMRAERLAPSGGYFWLNGAALGRLG
jgi:hypothetical protein